MKRIIKISALLLSLLLIVSAVSGCNLSSKVEGEGAKAYEDAKAALPEIPTDTKIAENENYILGWNAERISVTVTNKKDGTVWGTNLNDFVALDETVAANETVNSPITIQYAKNSIATDIMAYGACIQNIPGFEGAQVEDTAEDTTEETAEGTEDNTYDDLDDGYKYTGGNVEEDTGGKIGSEIIDNGIRVTFAVNKAKSLIPIDFYLENGSVKVAVDPKNIKEFDIAQIISIGLTPFMCSGKNSPKGSTDSYVVLPSGSGALMYTDDRGGDVARVFSSEIYGDDLARSTYQDTDNNSNLSMPFFGIKTGNNGIMATVESGADVCDIKAQAGDPTTGYSYAYAYCDVRGQNRVYLTGVNRNKYVDNLSNIDPIIVSYDYLTGEDATYYGMAKRYRQKLVDDGKLKKSGANKLLNVNLIGSFMKDNLFLGIPTENAKSLTTYEQATEMLTKLKDVSGGNMSAVLTGFGDRGVEARKIAAGYTLWGASGSKKDLQSFIENSNSLGVPCFFNFDVLTFSASGAGISKNRDAALNNTHIAAPLKNYYISKRNVDNSKYYRYLVARDKIQGVVDKTVDLANQYGINNISYDTIGALKYADYKGDKYPSGYNMSNDINAAIKTVTDKDKTVLVDGAYDYAACAADVLTGCPVTSNRDWVFDADVPLYQIVFQGYKENYAAAINTAANPKEIFLKAVSTGSGLSFTLIHDYDIELVKENQYRYGSCVYEDNIGSIETYVSQCKDFLASVADKQITSHAILDGGVTKTVFEGGKTVYVNYGDKSVTAEGVTVPAQNFVVR